MIKLMLGDCINVLKSIPDNSVDSIVTDPPYGINFMNKGWDNQVPGVDVWAECLRVLKPGGHLLAFAGTRTQHRMATRIEDAGFEIRDMMAWVYGSGFPKSMDVSKAIDKAAGAEREVIEEVVGPTYTKNAVTSGASVGGAKGGFNLQDKYLATAPSTDEAKQWDGWGTALKPALEPITVARKPFAGTVANNVLNHGTGAINIDGCRVPGSPWKSVAPNLGGRSGGIIGKATKHPGGSPHEAGRFPANLIHDGSDEVVELFPGLDDKSAARFFYCPKASKKDRDEGLELFAAGNNMRVNAPRDSEAGKCATLRKNIHPTVKPTDLMAYLCRLVTRPGGTVLDPFMGSGSTGKAAAREGFDFIGIELSEEYFEIAKARIDSEKK